ncbi:hypothetical protein MHTCC0001_16340 [Flavobacteriaceae bacterium MHTCC 0001]
MTIRFLAISSICILLVCCKKNTENDTTKEANASKNSIITELDIKALQYTDFGLDQRAKQLVEPWEAYQNLEGTITAIKTADFSFFETDEKATLELVKSLKESIPDTLNTPSIYSRIKIVETMLYKTEDVTTLTNIPKPEVAKTIKDLFVSFSNLNFQINKKIEKDNRKIVRP